MRCGPSEVGRQPGDRAGSQEGARTDGGEGDEDGGGKNSQTVWGEGGGRDRERTQPPHPVLERQGEAGKKWKRGEKGGSGLKGEGRMRS